MKPILSALLLPAVAALMAPPCSAAEEADSVDLAAFANAEGKSGLQLAWRADENSPWQKLNSGNIVSSDFGPWGSHKKMFDPLLQHNADGSWTATWIADPKDPVLATVSSPDLMKWGAQSYRMTDSRRRPTVEFDFDGERFTGSVVRVPASLISTLRAHYAARGAEYRRNSELMKDDPTRFAGLESPVYTVRAIPAAEKPISDKLIGIFFEDINYSADGGLYAELVQNRDFEYAPSDRGNDRNWNPMTAWSVDGSGDTKTEIRTSEPVHANNPHYMSLDVRRKGASVVNSGYDGISLAAGEDYDFSMFVRSPKKGKFAVAVVDTLGNAVASATVKFKGAKDWQKVSASLRAKASCSGARLVITPENTGSFDIDMVSLFPRDTFKGRKNGLRRDLAQTLADLHPRFVRFPGGCVAHGDGIDNIYDWKGSIGPLESRKPLRNLWGYHQSRGLGYHEYFLFCEDIGAEPLPVLAAGVPCQNSGTAAHHSCNAVTTRGQQDGIPMSEMPAYIQDVLDLIEYANGDPATSVWAAKRAEAGHPEPFNLKYIGIGNEDMITEVFVPRFKMIFDAVREKYPDISVVGTVGPFYEGTDYDLGWKLAREENIPMVDEHYYVAPGWLINNQNYYDSYPRGGTKVYLGEYASHRPDRKSTMETALTEALYLTAVERNGDVVAMTSYAPLLAKDRHTQWRPDLIYFDNDRVNRTTDYYVQKMYGNNSGQHYIPAETALSTGGDKARVRVGSSIVRDEATGDYIVKLANLLPVEVKTDADLSAISGLNSGSSRTIPGEILSGEPDSETTVPAAATATLTPSGHLTITLPPYSFAVFRLK